MKKKFLCYFLTISLLILFWEFFAKNNASFAFLCPPPSKIAANFSDSMNLILSSSWYTLRGILGGFFLALLLSIGLVILMLTYKPAKDLLNPFFILVQCTPMFTLAPLIVLWFGWGLNAVIVPTALTVFFPLTITIYQGITSTPEELLEQFILHQATKRQIFIKLRLPYALPHIFSGLKIAMGSAGFAAIAGEWVASQSGLGILILESRRNYDMEMTFSGLFALTTVTFILFQSILLSEKLTFALFRIEKTTKKFRLPNKKFAFLLIPLLILPIWKVRTKQINPSNLTPITILLDWTPNPNHIPLYVGVSKGFFRNQGIDLHIQKSTDTGAVIPHVLFEQVDLTLYHALGVIKTSLQGAPVQIVGSLIDSTLQGFIYRKEDNISKFEDLNNRVLGFCLNNSRDLSCLLETLRLHGVVPSDVRNVSSDLISPMLLKKIDFLYGAFYNIEGVKLDTLGMPVGCFLSDSYGLPTGPQLLLCGKKDTKATSPEVVEAIQIALQQSIDYCKKYPKKAFQAYLKATPDTPKIVKDEVLQWEATLPLFAKSQEPLSQELGNTLLQAIVHRYPNFADKVSNFSLNQIYPSNSQVCQDEKTHEQAEIIHLEVLPSVSGQH
ncbi:ABC transporter substrate-binding protein [Chlamydia crocodili]|uniref:ABC transporter substrate-binding protein n=1 Tax=Chlamydia crocodili TaxID=2766982 RepID=A0ABX8CI65_9CHLA|nr:ABC transporter substrate-binding protein [Chlamydia crocodili]QVE49277.1 ABC transporter substrate-binding protein [Chlamydia crocodili]